jgi:hypothetical protein
MIIKENCWYSLICKLFPNVLILRYEECDKWLGLGVQVQVWFSEVDPPRKLSLFHSSSRALIVTARRARHVPKGEWNYLPICVIHSDCGGATDGSWMFHIYHQANELNVMLPASVPGRDLMTILDSKVQ